MCMAGIRYSVMSREGLDVRVTGDPKYDRSTPFTEGKEMAMRNNSPYCTCGRVPPIVRLLVVRGGVRRGGWKLQSF